MEPPGRTCTNPGCSSPGGLAYASHPTTSVDAFGSDGLTPLALSAIYGTRARARVACVCPFKTCISGGGDGQWNGPAHDCMALCQLPTCRTGFPVFFSFFSFLVVINSLHFLQPVESFFPRGDQCCCLLLWAFHLCLTSRVLRLAPVLVPTATSIARVAFVAGNESVVRYLPDEGANSSSADARGLTPTAHGAHGGYLLAVRVLLKANATCCTGR